MYTEAAFHRAARLAPAASSPLPALLTRTIWKRQVALVALVLRRSVKR